MDENVGQNSEIGNCNIKLGAMCVEGGLENWWPIAFNGKMCGKIHLRGEWIAQGNDPVAFTSSQMPGLQQQTVSHGATVGATMMMSGPRSSNYQMPTYNQQQASAMQPPRWADRQYQDMQNVHQKGFMDQSRKF